MLVSGIERSPSIASFRGEARTMTMVALAHRSILCGLVLSLAVTAQCPPPGGYASGPPPIGGTWTPGQSSSPSSPSPAGPSAPAPAGPSAPGPEQPGTDGPTTPRGPAPAARVGPRTGGGIPLSFERGSTSKDRLKIDWVHPVPPKRSDTQTSASGPLSLEEALAQLWDSSDQRPLLVLRECNLCKDGDEALLQRSLNNDRTLLLTKWFRTVRLPAHIAEAGHPFHNVFAGYAFKDSWPHFFLLAHPGAVPVTFTGTQTQAQLWKGMHGVLEQRYAKDAAKAVKEWMSVLDSFDTIDARRRQLQEQLEEVRATDGPTSSRAKKLNEQLAKLDDERTATIARETKVRDLGLLPMPRQVGATTK
jgi:hypothetical protein